MNLIHPNRPLRVRPTAGGGNDQARMQGAEIEPAIDAIGKHGEISGCILSEGECVVTPAQTSLEVAQDSADPLEPGQVFRFSSGNDPQCQNSWNLNCV